MIRSLRGIHTTQLLKNAEKDQKHNFYIDHRESNKAGFVKSLNYINDKTTHILGQGANPGIRTKKDENDRIIHNHQPSYKRNSFKITI